MSTQVASGQGASGSFRLIVLTPEQTLLNVRGATWVKAQLADGAPISIYPGHAPLLAEMVTAPLHYADGRGEHTLELDGGILQVNQEGVTIFTGGPVREAPNDDARFDRLAQEMLTRLKKDTE